MKGGKNGSKGAQVVGQSRPVSSVAEAVKRGAARGLLGYPTCREAFLVGGEIAATPVCRFQQQFPCGGFHRVGRYVKKSSSTADPPFQRKEFCVMPYAIIRFEKRKGGPTSAIEKHHG